MSDSRSFAQRRSSGYSVRTPQQYPSPTTSSHPQSHSRRSSQNSTISATTPSGNYSGLGFGDSTNPIGVPAGLGSLADELSASWDEEEGIEGVDDEATSHDWMGQSEREQPEPVSGIAVETQTISALQSQNGEIHKPISPSKSRPSSPMKQHQRTQSAYDGSEYGDEAVLEVVDSISPSLERRMADVEALARQRADTIDVIWQQLSTQLRDLPSQLGIETRAGGLVTTHTAVTSYLVTQSRTFTSLTHPLLSPFSVPLDPDVIDEVLPLVTSLVAMLPLPPPNTLTTLHALNTQTIDLLSTLSTLSDTLYMARQTSSSASRRLRAAKEVVETLKKEIDLGEEGALWLERGNWGERIKTREAAKFCTDVVDGFEDVCNSWRQRLIENNGGLGGLDVAPAKC